LRQIGVRDEAKMLGGIGPCGRPLCCSTWLGDFEPVSIKMAKDQGLSLNPTKISGICGRLMCCLKYEQDQYEAAKAELPDVGSIVVTDMGEGRVVGLHLNERAMTVKLDEGFKLQKFKLEEVTVK
jgi:cell fate regulator YaaT (PSP1 superfamily)